MMSNRGGPVVRDLGLQRAADEKSNLNCIDFNDPRNRGAGGKNKIKLKIKINEREPIVSHVGAWALKEATMGN